MELYEKLTGKYPSDFFSISTTQTVVKEDDPGAVTRSIIFKHTGMEVLKIDKQLFVFVRDAANASAASTPAEVCDGAVATEAPSHAIGYVELKSACTANNVVKARAQLLASARHLQTAALSCDLSLSAYVQKGIIVTQPITDRNRTFAIKNRRRDDALHKPYSSARFLLKLIEGKASDEATGIEFVHALAGEVVEMNRL